MLHATGISLSNTFHRSYYNKMAGHIEFASMHFPLLCQERVHNHIHNALKELFQHFKFTLAFYMVMYRI